MRPANYSRETKSVARKSSSEAMTLLAADGVGVVFSTNLAAKGL